MPKRTAVGASTDATADRAPWFHASGDRTGGTRAGSGRAGGTRRARAAIAAIVVLAAQLMVPAIAAADDGIDDSATTTYTLVPDAGRIDVSITWTLKNTTRSKTVYNPCLKWEYDPYYGWRTVSGTCPSTTSYYFNSGHMWIERAATNLKATADKGTPKATVTKREGDFVEYKIDFARLNYGQTRRITVTYSIPGGAPRSDSTVRAGLAYASFCAIAHGSDTGSATIIVPSAFQMEVDTSEKKLEPKTEGPTTTYATGSMTTANDFWACFTGDDPDGYASTSLISPSGRQIVLEAWPEDSEWADQTRGEIAEAIGALEALVGRGLPGTGAITVREVGPGDEGWAYAGTFDPEDLVARITERLDEPGVVAHELAHTWFNDDLFSTRWLAEGSAAWAASTITGDECTNPGLPSGKSKPPLVTWKFAGPRASEEEMTAIHYEYDAACYVVSEIADRIGEDGMRAVFAALLDYKVAYQSGSMPSSRNSAAVGARQWLDTVDELGLVPAGVDDLDFAQELLWDFRAIPDRAALDDRSLARAAYHDLLDRAGDWDLPPAILKPMSAWAFHDAEAAIAAAETALDSIDTVKATLPAVDVDAGPVIDLFEDAATLEDLEAAADLAAEQAEAAAAVAAAESQHAAPRDILASIGLIGTDLRPNLERGLAAVAAADLATAQSESAHVAAVLAAANQDGIVRVAVTVVALLVLLLAVFLIRRRRTRRAAAAASVVLAAATSDVAIGDVAAMPEAAMPEAAVPEGLPSEPVAGLEPVSAEIDPRS